MPLDNMYYYLEFKEKQQQRQEENPFRLCLNAFVNTEKTH